MKKLLSIILIISELAVGNEACLQSVTFIKQDKPAPCTGYLFSPDKELEVRLKTRDYDYLQSVSLLKDKQIEGLTKYNLNLDSVIELKDKQIVLWQNRATESTEKLVSSESGRGWRDAMFFAFGIMAVLFGAWSINQVK